MDFTLSAAIIFFVFVVIAALVGHFSRHTLKRVTTRGAFALALPFVFPFLIILWGIVWHWEGATDTEPAWRLASTSWLLFLLYPSLCVFSIWRSPGLRFFAAALIPLSLLMSLAACAFAVAFVTND
jgi:hypothetical protein